MNDLLANRKIDFNGEEMTYEAAICITMVKEALEGNVAAARFVSDAVDNALKTKEVQAKIKKLEAETQILKQQQGTGISSDKVVIIDDIGNNETE